MGIRNKIKQKFFNKFAKRIPVFVNVTQETVLYGRTALITGGTSGIGYSIAESFLKAGARVIVVGRDNGKISSTVEQLEQFGEIYGLQTDISNVSEMEGTLSDFLQRFEKTIDILVNSAGVNSRESFGNITESGYDAVMDTNLKGTLFVSQVFANYWISHKIKGNILNIVSTGGFRPADTAYRISKWGQRGLTLGMAKKLIPYGIVVNGIAPGPTATGMLDASNDDLSRERNPAGRMATTEEVAEMAKYLVSSAGRLAVGEVVSLSGGAGVITFDDIDY